MDDVMLEHDAQRLKGVLDLMGATDSAVIVAAGLDAVEMALVERFRRYATELSSLKTTDDGRLKELLLQRRLLTLYGFDRFYNTAICALEDPKAARLAERTFAEEYAGKSHRRALVNDLERIGIPRKHILTARPTPATLETAEQLVQLVDPAAEGFERTEYDVRALTALRVAGELLPGVEYGLLTPEISRRFGLREEDSEFFFLHGEHDARREPFGKGTSHVDRYGAPIVRLIGASDAVMDVMSRQQDASCMILESYRARLGFYAQFR